MAKTNDRPVAQIVATLPDGRVFVSATCSRPEADAKASFVAVHFPGAKVTRIRGRMPWNKPLPQTEDLIFNSIADYEAHFDALAEAASDRENDVTGYYDSLAHHGPDCCPYHGTPLDPFGVCFACDSGDDAWKHQ